MDSRLREPARPFSRQAHRHTVRPARQGISHPTIRRLNPLVQTINSVPVTSLKQPGRHCLIYLDCQKTFNSFLEQGEGRCGFHIFLAEGLIGHAQHEYTLNKGDNRPETASYKRQADSDEAGTGLAEVEILHAKTSDQYGQQRGNATALAFRAAGVKRIVIASVSAIYRRRNRATALCLKVIAAVTAEL